MGERFTGILCTISVSLKRHNIILLLMSSNPASQTPAAQVVSPGSRSPHNTLDYTSHTVSLVSILYPHPCCSKEIQCKPLVILNVPVAI